MPPALLNLMKLQWRGVFRRVFRGASSPRIALMFAVGIAALVLWLAPMVVLTLSHRYPKSDPERIRLAAPFALLGICLLTLITSVGDRAISFTPGEVDLLFPGPFTRRQLIAYKLFKSTLAAALSAVVLSFTLMRHARWWPACYIGVVLTLLFIQFFSINSVLIVQTLGERVQGWMRTAIRSGVVIAALLIGRKVAPAAGSFTVMQWMRSIDASDIGHAMLAPFAMFGRTITAGSATELLREGAPAFLVVLALFGLINFLDANYFEVATAASARRSAHLQRIRGGSFLSVGVGSKARWNLPQLPRLRGAGPILWRQFSSAARSSRGLLFLLVILAVGCAPLLGMKRGGTQYATTLASVVVWMTLLISTMLKFDFRGDLDLMDFLKALPIHPYAIALGQLAAPSLLMTAAHLVLLTLIARGNARVTPFVSAAFLVLPLNFLLFAIENLIFLLFPTRPAVASAGDFSILGRQVFALAGKMFALAALASPPLALALFFYVLAGKSFLVFTLVAGALLIAEVIALIPLIGWAFQRFDPSIHTPA